MTDARQSRSKTVDESKRSQTSRTSSSQNTPETDPFIADNPSNSAESINANEPRPGTQALRQNAILRMQRTQGNAAVNRFLAQRVATDTVQREPPTTAPAATTAPPAVGQLNAVEQAFMNKTTEAGLRLNLAAGKFSEWLSGVTIPYAQAWASHKTALQSMDKAVKSVNELALAAVLAFIPGGAGGIVGSTIKDLGGGVALVDGVKDLAKFGLRSAGSTAAPGASAGFQAFPPDPLVWESKIKQRAEGEVLNPARAALADWANKVNNHDPNFDCTGDPVAAINNAMHMPDGSSLFTLAVPDQPTLKTSYEKGFLKDWIDTQIQPYANSRNGAAWEKLMDKLIEYGKRIGWPDVRDYVHKLVGIVD